MNTKTMLIMALIAVCAQAVAEDDYGPYENAPRLYAADGTYLGRISNNRQDPESINNPNGQYGSQFGQNSIRNPYSRYGNPLSPYSTNYPGNKRDSDDR